MYDDVNPTFYGLLRRGGALKGVGESPSPPSAHHTHHVDGVDQGVK
jgi:hypothetical protein